MLLLEDRLSDQRQIKATRTCFVSLCLNHDKWKNPGLMVMIWMMLRGQVVHIERPLNTLPMYNKNIHFNLFGKGNDLNMFADKISAENK